MNDPTDIFFDSAWNLWIADYGNGRIREYGTNGICATVVGGGSTYTEGGFPLATVLAGPHSVVVDASGNIYIADSDDNRVFASNHRHRPRSPRFAGPAPTASPATAARPMPPMVNTPTSRRRSIRPATFILSICTTAGCAWCQSGTISTVAGTGAIYYSGDGGAAQNAHHERTLLGRLFLGRRSTSPIRTTNAFARSRSPVRFRPSRATGTPGSQATAAPPPARSCLPQRVAVDASGILYIADTGNQRVRKVVNGTITTVAGNGSAGYSGDGGPAISATLNSPSGLAVDSAGEPVHLRFRQQRGSQSFDGGVISTIAGNGSPGYSGDGGHGPIARSLTDRWAWRWMVRETCTLPIRATTP